MQHPPLFFLLQGAADQYRIQLCSSAAHAISVLCLFQENLLLPGTHKAQREGVLL